MACLDDNTVAAFMDGTLTSEARLEVERHVETCAACRQLLAVVMRGDDDVPTPSMGPTLPTAMETQTRLAPGTQLSRYHLRDPLGAGGMGVVYAAWDPMLERNIAVKVVRGEGSAEALEEVRTRLQREGKAIAQLAHPNIVTVFDMGTSDGQVFIAMELVDGGSLRSWLKAEPRLWPEVVDKFCEAGQGLAAAHRAGLAHRDFKPENVLVGTDGRVRVTDFGLADRLGSPLAVGPDGPISKDVRLTQTGARLGTPAYMAPEQYAGLRADVLSDQFSFCVALWEAVVGVRPWEPSLDPAAWRFVEAPADTRAPLWLRRVLLKGLQLDPVARYPTMELLLIALRDDPQKARASRRWLAAGLISAAVLVGGSWGVQRRASGLCTGAEAEVASVWNQTVRTSLQQAFTATGAEGSAGWARVEPRLNNWWRDWASTHTEACRATRIRGDQSDQLLGLRMACLARARTQTTALLEVFAHADAEVVARAPEAVDALDSLAGCSNTEALLAEVTPPQGAELVSQVAGVRTLLAEARARDDAGQYKDALERATRAVTKARGLSYQPVLAEALLLVGRLQEHSGDLKGAEQSLLDAISTAESSKHDAVAAEAAAHLLLVLGARQARFAEAQAWEKLAEGALRRSGDSPLLRARLFQIQGLVRYNEGKLAEATETHQRAVALFEKVEPGSIALANALNDLAAALRGGRKGQESLAVYQRALDILLVQTGSESDLVAANRNGMANSLMLDGLFDDAFSLYEQALGTFRKRLGPTHFRTVTTLNNLGVVRAEQGRYADALPYFEQVLEARKTALAATDAKTADAWSNVGMLLVELGRYDEAMADFDKARGILQGYPLDHFSQAESLLGTAKIALARRHPEQAVPLLERVLGLCEKKQGFRFDYTRARAQFLMGRALAEGPKPSPQGRARVLEARAALVGFGEDRFRRDLAEVDAWLKSHGS